MPWVDLTSVTLMAFVFAATPKEEQMSLSPLYTPPTVTRPLIQTHPPSIHFLGFHNKIKESEPSIRRHTRAAMNRCGKPTCIILVL